MKFSKKLLAVLLAGVLALTMLTACGNSQVNVDLERSKAILNVINTKRADSGMGELKLSDSASQQLGAWAKAAATQNANPTKANVVATEDAKILAKYAVGNLTIDGKKIVKTWETYAAPGVTADDLKAAMERNPDQTWFTNPTEKDCNYVAIATYGSGDASATVVLMMLVK